MGNLNGLLPFRFDASHYMGQGNIGAVQDEYSKIADKLGVVLFHGEVGGLVLNECLWMSLELGGCLESHRSVIGAGVNRHWGKNLNLKVLL